MKRLLKITLATIMATLFCFVFTACGEIPTTPVESVVLSETSKTLCVGDELTLTATVNPDNATDKTLTWTSSNEDVATVVDGVVNAVSAGNATITVCAGGKTATCEINVIVAVGSVSLDITSTNMYVGDELTLTATVNPDNATDKTLTWTSSNEDVATVVDGVVNAVSAGNATITVCAGDKTATCEITAIAIDRWNGTDVATDEQMQAIYDQDSATYLISTASQFVWVEKQVNEHENSFAGKTIKLLNDIDLQNHAFTPIGQTGATQFLGTLDGNGKTIFNLKIDSSLQVGEVYSSGLFGWIERHGSDANYITAVKNLTINGANVIGHHNVAVIVGYLVGSAVENCHVYNATITNTHANDDACGDKTGVIVGFSGERILIKDCSATNCAVSSGRDAGQIVGHCYAAYVDNIQNCTATNVSVIPTGDCTGNNVREELIGRIN